MLHLCYILKFIGATRSGILCATRRGACDTLFISLVLITTVIYLVVVSVKAED